tara:strand:+ start:3566 stop:4396 length:831 start_codon:yes stop_codon:yes gene_type:complete
MKIPRSFNHPSLDVIEVQPAQNKHRPLLFIHGANMSAWCWNEQFMPFFANLGYPCYALSLRGHGNSGGHQQLATNSIADYVTDVQRVVEQLDEPPILVGHSLGGLVVQKYIEHNKVPACVLLATVPADGMLPSLMDLALYNPSFYTQLNLIQLLGTWSTAVDVARKAIFSGHVDDEVVIRYCAQMQPESPKALLDALWLGLPNKKNPFKIPMLALSADEDTFFRPEHIKQTAKAYGAEYVNMKETSHAMMLDSHWQQSADTIKQWLHQLQLETAPG